MKTPLVEVMSTGTAFIRRSLILIMVLSNLSLTECFNAQDAKALIFSGDPPVYPKMPPSGSGPISTIKGDLVIENFDARTLVSVAAKSGFAQYGEIEKVTGTVIRNLTAPKLSELTFLKEIGGDLIMHNNPDLESVDFLSNNISVKGSIEGKNNAKLCSRYSYLITVDDKYFSLFDDDCLTMTGDVDILKENTTIGEKKRIKGSLICIFANNPNFTHFDSKLMDSLKSLVGVGSLILDDCPITSLSSTLSSLKEVDTAVKIINCDQLDDKKFSEWLHKLKTDPSKMILKNNDNVCLESNHVEEWKSKHAQISEHRTCGHLTGDVNLSDTRTMINGTTRVIGSIYCIDMKEKEFSPDAIKFLMNIKMANTLEFINCSALVKFKNIFRAGYPNIGNVVVVNCTNIETDISILELVNGKKDSIKMTGNRKVCFSAYQLQSKLSGSSIEQAEFCGKDCPGGRVAYRNGVMKSNINLTEDCDKITGELYFEGELPSEDELLFANIKLIEGNIFLNAIKNKQTTNRTFNLLPNLQKIIFNSHGRKEEFFELECAVMILNVKEIDHINMKRLESINCPSNQCICIEGSPEVEKSLMSSRDWPAISSNQTSVVIYPKERMIRECSNYTKIEKHWMHIVVFLIGIAILNSIIVIAVVHWFREEKVRDDIKLAKNQCKERDERRRENRKEGSKEKGKDNTKENSAVHTVTEPTLDDDSRLWTVNYECLNQEEKRASKEMQKNSAVQEDRKKNMNQSNKKSKDKDKKNVNIKGKESKSKESENETQLEEIY